MSNRQITSIPCRTEDIDHFRSALRQLADEKNKKVGDLVRDAIDAMYGDELAPLLSYFAKRGKKNARSVTIVTGNGAKS